MAFARQVLYFFPQTYPTWCVAKYGVGGINKEKVTKRRSHVSFISEGDSSSVNATWKIECQTFHRSQIKKRERERKTLLCLISTKIYARFKNSRVKLTHISFISEDDSSNVNKWYLKNRISDISSLTNKKEKQRNCVWSRPKCTPSLKVHESNWSFFVCEWEMLDIRLSRYYLHYSSLIQK